MRKLAMRTSKCIVTGEPAKVFTGHLLLESYGPIDAEFRIKIRKFLVIAGFASSEQINHRKSDVTGCFGDWSPEMGLSATEDHLDEIEIQSVSRGQEMIVRRE